MSKQESLMMKGLAILLMLFYHLFNQLHNIEECNNMIIIDGLPLVYILCRAANPVAFFLVLGGYGLYKANEKGDRHRWSRLAKLFIHYWLVLLIFVSLGHILNPSKYPGNLSNIIANIISFHTTYNAEMWFLFPYAVLSLLAPYIFKLMRHLRAWQIITTTLSIYICTSFCISRFGAEYLFNNLWIYNPLLVFHLLFSFSLGAVAARTNFFKSLKAYAENVRHINVLRLGGGNCFSINKLCD